MLTCTLIIYFEVWRIIATYYLTVNYQLTIILPVCFVENRQCVWPAGFYEVVVYTDVASAHRISGWPAFGSCP